MGLLALMSFLNLILVVGLYIASQGGHMPNKYELRLLDLVEQHSNNGEDEVYEQPGMTSHNILLEVHDAITEPNKLLSYEKTVVAHHKVKNYVLTMAGKPIELRPIPERPILKAVK
ncbi:MULTISPECIES: hypothetical protein [unclassified Pseudoalteromonas]|uniref:hypothetical protein n=1 Tax=unclassified Pseudoalteromonas TaxID=194690 RepID=UPI001BA7DD80|nr:MULTISPECIES: hypothetical protein [unclassified Pseudoalteromonas]MCF2826888.1 hypothetical protein [Pseudoalteromonas sp. OF5H-5]MCF2830585.1 hypothetical protein [Pseudoalteromonas sp. DL2-H6]MCF2923983.1 hypothetical protein [Pseudoalteromonas sp. DL2-H1]QUI71287.1 hypothetical protein GSF13_16700 [Pseudoalteromonas sp. M8]